MSSFQRSCTGECDPTTGAFKHRADCKYGRRKRYATAIAAAGNFGDTSDWYDWLEEADAVIALADQEIAVRVRELVTPIPAAAFNAMKSYVANEMIRHDQTN